MTKLEKAKKLIEKNKELKVYANNTALKILMLNLTALILLTFVYISGPSTDLISFVLLNSFFFVIIPLLFFFLLKTLSNLRNYGFKFKSFYNTFKDFFYLLRYLFYSYKYIVNGREIKHLNKSFELLLKEMNDDEFTELISLMSAIPLNTTFNVNENINLMLKRERLLRQYNNDEDLIEKMLNEKIKVKNEQKKINHIE